MRSQKELNQAKKIKEMIIDISDNGLLGKGSLSEITRMGDYEGPKFKERCVVKILALNKIPNESDIRLTYFYKNYIVFSMEQQCQFLIKGLSFQQTQNNIYFAFSHRAISLQQIQQKCFNDEQMLELLTSCTQALLYLRENKCLHGNIKLSNIFQSSDKFDEKIYQFSDYYGFKYFHQAQSKIHKEILEKIIQNNIASKQINPFISPELKEQPNNPTIKSDIYALGIVCYQMAFNQLPKSQSNEAAKNLNLSISFRKLIQRMIEPNVQTRIDLDELINTIQNIQKQNQYEEQRIRCIQDKGIDPNQIVSLFKKKNHEYHRTLKLQNLYKETDQNSQKQQITQKRNRAIAYITLVQWIRDNLTELKSLQICEIYLNSLIFSSFVTIVHSFKQALPTDYNNQDDEVELTQLIKQTQSDLQDYIFYMNKAIVLFDQYIHNLEMNYQLCAKKPEYLKWMLRTKEILKQFISQDIPDELIIYDSLQIMKHIIIENDVLRRIELQQKQNTTILQTIHIILALHKVEYLRTIECNQNQFFDYNELFQQAQIIKEVNDILQFQYS